MNIEWVKTENLRPNPKNRNVHSDEQIERLAEIIKYQGWRFPVVADKENVIWAGHGRVLAAKKIGVKEIPVSYQEFTSPEQAYAFLVSDNAIASWAELDLSGINSDIGDLGPDFDIDLLGIKEFSIVPEFGPGSELEQGKLDEKKPVQCPNCGEQFVPKL